MGCVPSMNDEKALAPTVFPQPRSVTDGYWFPIFVVTTVITLLCVITCSLYADLSNLKTMDEFWENDILLLIEDGRYYLNGVIVCLFWSAGLSVVLIAMMQYIADILIVASIGAVSFFLLISMGLLWNMYVVEPLTEPLIGASAVTIFLICWFVFLLEIGNKMNLIYKLYEIAGVITFQNPWILIWGVLNFLANLIVLGFGVFFFCIISSAWYEIRETPELERLQPLIVVSYTLTIFTTVWWLLFFECCQKFITGYCVAGWYFDDEQLNEEGATYNAILDLYEFHLGTVSLASLIYTIMFIPMEFLNLCRKLKGQKWIMKCCALFPEALTLWFASLTEMLSGSPIYTCAMYSVPFCMATNRSMVLTNFAMRLRIIMLGNVLCTMCIILVSLASTVLTLAMANPEYRDHAVYFGLFLFLFSTLISSMLLVVFLNVTKSLYVCIYHDMMANGIDLPFTVIPNINTYVMEVQMFVQNSLGVRLPPDQLAGGIPATAIPEMRETLDDADDEDELFDA